MTAHSIKSGGYLVSILSVLLLAIPSLKSAKEEPAILLCILAGAATSVLGMALRWVADRKTQRRITRAEAENDRTQAAAGRVVPSH